MPLRIGLLGAAAIAPRALMKPSQAIPELSVGCIAARNRERAERFAKRGGIPVVHDTYEQVVTDPSIDAVYNPLVTSEHHKWTLRALEAGKHVLCEKPLAMNEAEALEMADAAQDAGLVCAEAFHYHYHPIARRMREIVQCGLLGRIRSASAHFQNSVENKPGEFRYRTDLGGGTTMEMACYPLHMLRHLFQAEPEVVSACAEVVDGVDTALQAELRFPDEISANAASRMTVGTPYSSGVEIIGERGVLRVSNLLIPQYEPHLIELQTDWGTRRETLSPASTFLFQMQAFLEAVAGGAPMPTDADDGVVSMRVIDNVFRAAGLSPRGQMAELGERQHSNGG